MTEITATKIDVIKLIGNQIPSELIALLLDEYQEIKTQFALGRYRPDELSGGRFAEIFLRIFESLGDPRQQYTPIGTQINRVKVVNSIKNNGVIPISFRIFLLPLIEILLDVRNRRDVAHIGVEINPNFSDSRLVCQIADWSLTELIRLYNQCTITDAQIIVDRINLIRIPLVAEYRGFVRVLDAQLKASSQVLVILYHKQPEPQKDIELCHWVQYKNPTRFKSDILGDLHKQAYVHYDKEGWCFITPVGIRHVEKNISLELST